MPCFHRLTQTRRRRHDIILNGDAFFVADGLLGATVTSRFFVTRATSVPVLVDGAWGFNNDGANRPPGSSRSHGGPRNGRISEAEERYCNWGTEDPRGLNCTTAFGDFTSITTEEDVLKWLRMLLYKASAAPQVAVSL